MLKRGGDGVGRVGPGGAQVVRSGSLSPNPSRVSTTWTHGKGSGPGSGGATPARAESNSPDMAPARRRSEGEGAELLASMGAMGIGATAHGQVSDSDESY